MKTYYNRVTTSVVPNEYNTLEVTLVGTNKTLKFRANYLTAFSLQDWLDIVGEPNETFTFYYRDVKTLMLLTTMLESIAECNFVHLDSFYIGRSRGNSINHILTYTTTQTTTQTEAQAVLLLEATC